MKTKTINFLLISILFVTLGASAAPNPKNLIELDAEVDSLWFKYPIIEFSAELISDVNATRSQAEKSKHFLFYNEYCKVFTETDLSVSSARIGKNSAYEIESMYIIDDIVLPSEIVNTQVYFRLINSDYETAVVEIVCDFPSKVLTGSSDLNKFFELGLNNIASYYKSFSF